MSFRPQIAKVQARVAHFYRIRAEQLKRVRGSSGLTYMGSDAEHTSSGLEQAAGAAGGGPRSGPARAMRVTERIPGRRAALPRVRKLDQSTPAAPSAEFFPRRRGGSQSGKPDALKSRLTRACLTVSPENQTARP